MQISKGEPTQQPCHSQQQATDGPSLRPEHSSHLEGHECRKLQSFYGATLVATGLAKPAYGDDWSLRRGCKSSAT